MDLRGIVGGTIPGWDSEAEEMGKKHNKHIIHRIMNIQRLFGERLETWTQIMAPAGWKRQGRWNQRGWMKVMIEAFRHNMKGRRRRRYGLRCIGQALMREYRDDVRRRTWEEHGTRCQREKRKRVYGVRCIGQVLMRIYRDEEAYMTLIEQNEAHRRKHGTREWVGKVERWVDAAHAGTHVVGRVKHSMRCLIVYCRWVHREEVKARKRKAEVARQKRHAWWPVLACAMRLYKQDKQQKLLEDRLVQRRGLVCASTRNVGRLGPKGGVRYDETRRNKPRIKETEMYRTHRWPRRDKCGPTLVGMLYHVWDIT